VTSAELGDQLGNLFTVNLLVRTVLWRLQNDICCFHGDNTHMGSIPMEDKEMNIFILSGDPTEAAVAQINKHIVKMPLETAQMLCAAYPDGIAPYKKTHYNHPCTVWARTCIENFNWLVEHGIALCQEYTYRYGRRHKCQDVIEWCRDNPPNLFTLGGKTAFAVAISDDAACRSIPNFDSLSVVDMYRAYYVYDKSYIATWKHREPPMWWLNIVMEQDVMII